MSPIQFEDEKDVWDHPDWWAYASTSSSLISVTDSAVEITQDDPHLQVNVHDFRLGPQRFLHDHGQYAFDQIRDLFDFGSWDAWDYQRTWLINLFKEFYGESESAIGTFSILAARRPAFLRSQQDSSIIVSQKPSKIHFPKLAKSLGRGRLRVGDTLVCMEKLRMAGLDRPRLRDRRLAMSTVPRRVESTRLKLSLGYQEFWWCLADPEDHMQLLHQGRLPAWSERVYLGKAGRIRTSPMLNLVRIGRDLSYTILAVELDPASAEVICLRWARYPMSVALLQGSPVEHRAVRSALRKRLNG
jgi:hypothetical protein